MPEFDIENLFARAPLKLIEGLKEIFENISNPAFRYVRGAKESPLLICEGDPVDLIEQEHLPAIGVEPGIYEYGDHFGDTPLLRREVLGEIQEEYKEIINGGATINVVAGTKDEAGRLGSIVLYALQYMKKYMRPLLNIHAFPRIRGNPPREVIGDHEKPSVWLVTIQVSIIFEDNWRITTFAEPLKDVQFGSEDPDAESFTGRYKVAVFSLKLSNP